VTHDPVLLSAALELLAPQSGETVLDVTIGLGGHAQEFLHAVGERGRFIGLDADAENLHAASARLGEQQKNVTLIHANFRDMGTLDLPPVDILFADLGVSSPHFDDPQRGFTFRSDAPLDLRYDRKSGLTGAECLRQWSAEQLADVLRSYGEVQGAYKLAQVIKSSGNVETTFTLKKCVEDVFGFRAPSRLPQIFQALRIAVNDELAALEVILTRGPDLLVPGGRMGVISYHSLEDRMVKRAFRARSQHTIDERTGAIVVQSIFEVMTRSPIRPDDAEVERNPRARSARFRVLRRRAPE
jgi:16S rRNA (cytosine1402-N4)-methyltransferase